MATLQVIDRDGVSHDVECKPGLKVMEVLRELDYGVAAICGGMCSCATCGENYCSSCLAMCSVCRKRFCEDCLEEGLCRSCQEKILEEDQDDDSDNDAECEETCSAGQGHAEPAGAPV